MSSRVAFTVRAELDLLDQWYAYPVVARALLDALRRTLRDVVSGRLSGIEVTPGIYCVPAARFPYLLYFTRGEGRLTVLAVKRAGVPWGLV